MNERIREFVAQADEWTDNQDIFSSEWRDYMLQKFAELIVRECASFVGDENSQAVKKMFEHFGVEE